MSKTYRYNPDEDFGGDNAPRLSKKEMKSQRRQRKHKDKILDDQMKPDDPNASDQTMANVLSGGWDQD